MIEVTPCPHPDVLAALHARSFAKPWSTKAFSDLLNSGSTIALAAVSDDIPLGFVLARQAADEVEVLTIGVAPQSQRSGIGSDLLKGLLSTLKDVRTLFIEVDTLNAGARAFYENAGFTEISIRKNYYQHEDGKRSDAIVMQLKIQ